MAVDYTHEFLRKKLSIKFFSPKESSLKNSNALEAKDFGGAVFQNIFKFFCILPTDLGRRTAFFSDFSIFESETQLKFKLPI